MQPIHDSNLQDQHDIASEATSHTDDDYTNDHDIKLLTNEVRAEYSKCVSHDQAANEDVGLDGSEPIIVIENTLEEELNKVPDGGWGWFVVLGGLLTHSLMGGFERSNGILYLQFRERYNASATTTAWVFSMFFTLRLMGGPVASALCNRYSCRSVTYIGAAIATVGITISGYAPSLGFLFFSYGVLGGIGRSLCYTPSLIIVGYYFNKRRGLAVGLATLGVGFGTFFMPPVVELLMDNYGFQGAFLILGAISSNHFVCGALSRPLELHRRIQRIDMLKKQGSIQNKTDTTTLLQTKDENSTMNEALRKRTQNEADVSSSMEIIAKAKIESPRSSLLKRTYKKVSSTLKGSPNKEKKPIIDFSLLKNFTFLCVCLAILLLTISFNSTFIFLPAIAKDRGLSQIDCAYIISILGIFDAISRLVMSVILDLKNVKQYRILVYNGVMFAVAAISLIIPSMTTFYEFVIVGACYGIFSGTYISQKSIVIVDVLGVENLSSSFGLLLLFQGVAGLIGPPVGGMIKDYAGHYDGAFYFGSGGIILGAFVLMAGNVVFWREKKKKMEEEKRMDKTDI